MSARDAESGSSTYKGGSGNAGGLGNGGIGGGMGGGHRGGGAGYNGGIGSRTGMTTGTQMYGNTAFGRPGGVVQRYGTRLTTGKMVDPRLANGQRPQPQVTAPQIPGLLGGAPVAAGAPAGIPVAPQYPAFEAEMALPEYPPVTEIDIPGQDAVPPEVVPGPAASFNPYSALSAYRSPFGPESLAQIGRFGQGRWDKAATAYRGFAGYGPDYGTANPVKGNLDTSGKRGGSFY